MVTYVYKFYTQSILLHIAISYFRGTQTLLDAPRLPPLPKGVSFFIPFCYLMAMISAIIGTISFLPSIILNIGLACGAPWGAYAMSGRHRIVPQEVRKAFVMPIVMQFVALWTLLNAGGILPEHIPGIITTILAFFFALYLTFYMATVLFSASYKEKTVMGTFAVISAICFWATAFGTLNYD